MRALRQPQSAITPLGFTQIPGGAQAVAASPDGSIWVVSSVPGGVLGNGIWHYANTVWTNIPGCRDADRRWAGRQSLGGQRLRRNLPLSERCLDDHRRRSERHFRRSATG